MTDWNWAIEDDNRRMFKRIVALLFALAGLAERLIGVPRPVRAFVLRILRSAEAVARDFVLETAQEDRSASFLPASTFPRYKATTVLPMRCGLRKAFGSWRSCWTA